MKEKIFVFTYRYMWQLKGNKSVNFKIVTDTEDGLALFEKNLKDIPGIERAVKYYISQIDLTKMGLYETLIKNEKENK